MTATIRSLPAIAFLFATWKLLRPTRRNRYRCPERCELYQPDLAWRFCHHSRDQLYLRAVDGHVVPWSTSLGGVSVSSPGIFVRFYYVSPTQINLLLPWKTPVGSYPLIVTANGQTVGPTNINIVSEAPGIFQYGANRAVAQNYQQQFHFEWPGRARGGGIDDCRLMLPESDWSTNTPADGAYSPGRRIVAGGVSHLRDDRGVNARCTFLGLTPGFVGLAQANITVPNLPSGDYPLVLTVSGVQSTSALISVKGVVPGLALIFNPLGTVYAPTSPLMVPLQGGASGIAQRCGFRELCLSLRC